MAARRPRSNSDSEYTNEQHIRQLISELQEPRPNTIDVPATDYARSWSSTLTLASNGFLTDEERLLLGHVNCSYLSAAHAPTLLALKQHAQSLAILIRKISTSTTFGIPDAMDEGSDVEDMAFRANEAFDWLNDLGEPYTNDDHFHNVPLFALRNTVEGESDIGGPRRECPLKNDKKTRVGKDKNSRLTKATHHELAFHANSCLERLDQEYSATGGLLSLLPAEDDTHNEINNVRKTFLGQWLLHQQHLVGRMHELEINYARALEVLAGEATVPYQLRRNVGSNVRKNGREVAYPQDKYILANVSEEVTEMIHKYLDDEEATMQEEDNQWRSRGVSGDRLQHNAQVSRGLVSVHLRSHFSRVKGQGHKSPIFLLPADDINPGFSHTRSAVDAACTVGVPTAVWPKRVPELEKNLKAKVQQEEDKARREKEKWRRERDAMELDRDMMRAKIKELERRLRERAH